MRLARLDLLRYGRFTDLSLTFPVGTPDLHIVFGPNEAGKSTTLTAIEDLLFGIPPQSLLDFLHDYPSLRIGAVLEKEGENLEIKRRKGKQETLLSGDDVPMVGGEALLAPYLSGADRTFFRRMFSLNNERLRQGGKEILEAQDEVGQMLFSAGSGLPGLRDLLKALEEEADNLWSSRRAAKRTYYQADDRREEAERTLRNNLVTPTKWQEAKTLHEAVRERYETLEREIEIKSSEKRKLDRLRRCYRNVRRVEEIDREIFALGEVPVLPEEALESFLKAEREEEKALAQIRVLSEQLATARSEISALKFDTALVHHADDIEKLHEGRIHVRDGKASLPKREAELAAQEAQFLLLASGLGWKNSKVEALIEDLPPKPRVTEVRRLLTKRGTILSAVESARQTLKETEEKVVALSSSLESLGSPGDLQALAAAVKAARNQGDLSGPIRNTQGEIAFAQEELTRLVQSIVPRPDTEIRSGENLPPRETIQAHRDRVRDMDKKSQGLTEKIRSEEQELAKKRKAYERLVRHEEDIAPEVLEQARIHRNTGWSLIRKSYIEKETVPERETRKFLKEGEDLVGAYEAAIVKADAISDHRVEKSDAAAQLALLARQILELEESLQGLKEEMSVLDLERRSLDGEWTGMWSGLPSGPLSPDIMLEWIGVRKEWTGAFARKSDLERKLAALTRQEEEIRQVVLFELPPSGLDASKLSGLPLSVVLERVEGTLSKNDRLREQRRKSEEEVLQEKIQVSRKKSVLEKADKDRSDWEKQWSGAVADLGLDPLSSPEAVAEQADAIEEMRTIAVRINDLRHERIGKIHRDCQAFAQEVTKTIPIFASDLVAIDPEEAVLQLERRLEEAKRMKELRNEKETSIRSLEEKIGLGETSMNEAREIIALLKSQAGVAEIPELKSTIERSDRARLLKKEQAQVLQILGKEGDGLPVSELRSECTGIDLDQISVREETVAQELEGLRKSLLEARDQRTEAQRAFEAVGGDDTMSKAEALRQEALSEMKEIAGRYTHVRTSAILLKWAIDRYRREKQAPLLKIAGSLFSLLTGGSFLSLKIDFDDQDRPHLTGVRPDRSTVHVSGLSTGTADQLYLALRIASVLEYFERAPALPFVIDDLFINFDDDRASAGFKVLAQLAEKTQVIFFTHHHHLVEIAKRSLGSSLSLVTL